jgi:hypothetical protein
VGYGHHKPNCRCRRPRPRICLRQGCGRQYQPRRWNQRYCQDPECLRLLRRWQAQQRQTKRRQDEAAKAQHAEAERVRRQHARSAPQTPNSPEDTAARGHAAKIFPPPLVCARPGCHEAPVKSGRCQARYCCPACRQAVRQVVDRERKWKSRGTFRGRCLREQGCQAARARRRCAAGNPNNASPASAPPS